MSISKWSPPAMPPAVLTKTADRPSASGDGKRTRNEPDSCRCRRRVTPSTRWTSNFTAPRARLASNIAEDALVVSVRIRSQALPRTARPVCGPRCKTRLQRHLAADFAGVEVAAIAGEFHRAPVHDGELVAELAGKVEILFDQDDGDVAEVAKIGDRPPDVLDDRRLDAFGRLV